MRLYLRCVCYSCVVYYSCYQKTNLIIFCSLKIYIFIPSLFQFLEIIQAQLLCGPGLTIQFPPINDSFKNQFTSPTRNLCRLLASSSHPRRGFRNSASLNKSHSRAPATSSPSHIYWTRQKQRRNGSKKYIFHESHKKRLPPRSIHSSCLVPYDFQKA